jgi:hypothetical protein
MQYDPAFKSLRRSYGDGWHAVYIESLYAYILWEWYVEAAVLVRTQAFCRDA